MKTGNIKVSAETLAFAAEQAARTGKRTASDYVESLLRSVRRTTARAELEAKLLEGMENPWDPTDGFLDELRAELLAKSNGKAKNGAKKRRS